MKHFQSNPNDPVWAAVQNRGEDDPDQYWIGRVTGIKQVYQRNGSVGRTHYGKGDAELSVTWYERDVSGGDERRTFKRWEGAAGEEYTFNSTELRLLGLAASGATRLDMKRLDSGLSGGAALREVQRLPSKRGAAKSARERIAHVTKTVRTQRVAPPAELWEITAASESAILAGCI